MLLFFVLLQSGRGSFCSQVYRNFSFHRLLISYLFCVWLQFEVSMLPPELRVLTMVRSIWVPTNTALFSVCTLSLVMAAAVWKVALCELWCKASPVCLALLGGCFAWAIATSMLASLRSMEETVHGFDSDLIADRRAVWLLACTFPAATLAAGGILFAWCLGWLEPSVLGGCEPEARLVS